MQGIAKSDRNISLFPTNTTNLTLVVGQDAEHNAGRGHQGEPMLGVRAKLGSSLSQAGILLKLADKAAPGTRFAHGLELRDWLKMELGDSKGELG